MAEEYDAIDIFDVFNLLKESLTTDDELDQFAAIEQQLDAASHRRQVALQDETTRIGELDHVLAQLRSTTTRGATDWRSTAAHGREMDRLETKRFECAKRINEQEQRLHGVEVELRAACDAQEELVRAEPVVVEDLDQQALKLQMMRNFGFMPAKSTPDRPVFDLLDVVSASSKQVNTIKVDAEHLQRYRITPHWVAGQLWAGVQ